MVGVADELVCTSTEEKTERMDLTCSQEASGWMLGLGGKSQPTSLEFIQKR